MGCCIKTSKVKGTVKPIGKTSAEAVEAIRTQIPAKTVVKKEQKLE